MDGSLSNIHFDNNKKHGSQEEFYSYGEIKSCANFSRGQKLENHLNFLKVVVLRFTIIKISLLILFVCCKTRMEKNKLILKNVW